MSAWQRAISVAAMAVGCSSTPSGIDATPDPNASCASFSADPGFTCSGSLGEGDTVAVAHPDAFGQKPNGAAALYIWDFSLGSATISQARIAKPAPGYGELVSDPVAPGSTKAWRHTVDHNFHEDTYRSGLEIGVPDLFVYARMYFNFDGHEAFAARETYTGKSCATDAEGCWNQKGWRFWHEFTHDWLIGYGDDDPAGNPRWGFGLQDDRPTSGTTYNGNMYPRSWHTQSVMVHQSSAINVADAWSQVTFNGRGVRTSDRLSRSSAFPEPLTRLYWFQVERTGWTASDGRFYSYDIVYIDDSFCRIVMTDQSVWDETAEHREEIQIPVDWNADRVTFRVRRPFPGAYLWVVRADATPLRIGKLP